MASPWSFPGRRSLCAADHGDCCRLSHHHGGFYHAHRRVRLEVAYWLYCTEQNQLGPLRQFYPTDTTRLSQLYLDGIPM